MPSIKIIVSKELDVDLNAYYPQFPRKLKLAIDEAVMFLAGGEKRQQPSRYNDKLRQWHHSGFTGRLTEPSRVVKLGTREPTKGVYGKVLFTALERVYGKKEDFMIADVMKLIDTLKKDGNLPKDYPSLNLISNLWRGYGLDAVK